MFNFWTNFFELCHHSWSVRDVFQFARLQRDFSEYIKLPSKKPMPPFYETTSCLYRRINASTFNYSWSDLFIWIHGTSFHLQGMKCSVSVLFLKDNSAGCTEPSAQMLFPCLLTRTMLLMVLLQLHPLLDFPWLLSFPSSLCTQSVTEYISSTHCTAASPCNLIVMYKFLLAGQ